ncbi:MAG: hypothetical protein H7Z12_06175 [Rhodospirillaceae bacterium]|nr:hypothetical protein [Rhodospirillales bacterium]
MADTIIQTDNFEDVHEAERLCLARRADGAGAVQGLALSGGGIRSASFAMGVMQALEAGGKLNAFHYLSTVSGGGYTGGSFSWFKAAKGGNCPTFPFGQLHQGARAPHPSMATRILNHIRQRANYLEPGYGFNSLSLVSVVLRTCTLISLGYMGLAALLFSLGLHFKLFTPMGTPAVLNPLLLAALGLVALQAVLAVLYSMGTGVPMRSSNLRYLSRRRLQVAGGRLLTLTLGLVVLGGLPILAAIVAKYSSDMLGWALTALGSKDNVAEVKVFADWFQTGDTVVRSAVFGAVIFLFAPIAAVKIFNKQGKDAPGGLFVGLGAASAVFGMLFLAYAWALYAHTENAIWPIGVAAGAVVLALVRNSNLFSLHCMYRDRLMEAFMPDSNVQPTNAWESAKAADKFQLSSILPCNGNPHCDTCKGPTAPFHLINTNAVLPDSHDVRYSGRAGDSFLLSPLYCGSNATGWMATRKYMRDGVRDGLSLASAVAISGAAVNGHTGPTPSSVTRNGFVSLLMSLFGLQLGVWVTNPRGTRWPLQPNDIFPGLNSLLGARMDGKASFVQLSDGGHFENLAIYELIRRGVQTIVVSDAGADPDYAFEDLGNAVEKVRVDFGVVIDFASTELNGILPGSATGGTLPDKYKLAKRGYAVGTIRYPGKPPGRLFYIKATLVDNLPADLYAYRAVNAAFPNDTTADQFFDEDQFEAYRGLGYALGWQLIEEQGAGLA